MKGRRNPAQSFIPPKAPRARYADEPGSDRHETLVLSGTPSGCDRLWALGAQGFTLGWAPPARWAEENQTQEDPMTSDCDDDRLNELPEFGAAAEEDLLFIYVTAKSVNWRSSSDLNASTIRSLGTPASSRSRAIPRSVPSR